MQRPAKKKNRRDALWEPALQRAVDLRTLVVGAIEFPTVPALAHTFIGKIFDLFRGFGHTFTSSEADGLRDLLARGLEKGYETSSEARLVFEFKTPPGKGIQYEIKLRQPSLEEHFETWAAMRKPPLFGKLPDAMVMHTCG